MKTPSTILKELEYGASCSIEITHFGFKNLTEFEYQIYSDILNEFNFNANREELENEIIDCFKTICE